MSNDKFNVARDFDEIVNLTNAREWEATEEKYTFCIDLLEISAQLAGSDGLVAELEEAFVELLGDKMV